jgi:hypothetical protein
MRSMRTDAIVSVLALALTSGALRPAAQVPTESVPLDLLLPGSPHGLVVGPERIVVGTGGLTVLRKAFSTSRFEGPFVLYVRNGRPDGGGYAAAAGCGSHPDHAAVRTAFRSGASVSRRA